MSASVCVARANKGRKEGSHGQQHACMDMHTYANPNRTKGLKHHLSTNPSPSLPSLPFDAAANLPTTPVGVMRYLEACGVDIQPGARCLVVGTFRCVCAYVVMIASRLIFKEGSSTKTYTPTTGRSKLVGLPLALLLLAKDATVTIAHSKTPQADLQGASVRLSLCVHVCVRLFRTCMYLVGAGKRAGLPTHPAPPIHTHT